MKKTYKLLLTLGVAASSLTSCSRGNYIANQQAPAYLASEQTAASSAPAALETTARVLAHAAPAAAPASAAVLAPAPAKEYKPKQAANQVAAAKAKPLAAAQRVVLNKLTKQLAKSQSKQQNTADVAQTAASKTGRAALIAAAGLVLILLGAAANVGIIATIGAIAFLVGIILVIVHLVSGD